MENTGIKTIAPKLHLRVFEIIYFYLYCLGAGRHGRDRMVVGFTTTCAIRAYHHESCEFEPVHGEVYLIQHYVIKFVSNLRQVDGFLQVLRFPPPIKLTATK